MVFIVSTAVLLKFLKQVLTEKNRLFVLPNRVILLHTEVFSAMKWPVLLQRLLKIVRFVSFLLKYLFHLLNPIPSYAHELLKLACHELGEANSFITDIAQKTVRERLAEILLLLVNDFGLDDQNYLQISLTREELANIVGTATESVIRLLSEFKTDKLVELNGRKIRILNTKGLEKISNVFN